mgnify:FL=1
MKQTLWFVFLWLLYALYVVYFLLSTGLENFFPLFDWRLFQRLLLVAAPAFNIYLWSQRDRMVRLDLFLIWVPFLAWVAAIYAFGQEKGLMNAAVVEPPIVGLLAGVYLLRFPLAARNPSLRVGRIAVTLCTVLTICAVLVARLIPPLPD